MYNGAQALCAAFALTLFLSYQAVKMMKSFRLKLPSKHKEGLKTVHTQLVPTLLLQLLCHTSDKVINVSLLDNLDKYAPAYS